MSRGEFPRGGENPRGQGNSETGVCSSCSESIMVVASRHRCSSSPSPPSLNPLLDLTLRKTTYSKVIAVQKTENTNFDSLTYQTVTEKCFKVSRCHACSSEFKKKEKEIQGFALVTKINKAEYFNVTPPSSLRLNDTYEVNTSQRLHTHAHCVQISFDRP